MEVSEVVSQLLPTAQDAVADGTDPFFKVDALVARPVAFSLAGEGLAAAVRALEGLGGVFLGPTVAVAPARVDAFGPVGFGHRFRGLDGIGRFWAAGLAETGFDPSHDLRLAGTCEDCQACRFLLRGEAAGVLCNP